MATRRQTPPPRLGEVEQLVLLALLKLDREAYAVPIRDLIASEGGIELSRATIYITLDRLETKGLLESWFSEPTGLPGGKARRIFRLRDEGLAALTAVQRAVSRLAAGTLLAHRSTS
jgi:DNA-binding PadR family transcriptional regulator